MLISYALDFIVIFDALAAAEVPTTLQVLTVLAVLAVLSILAVI